MGEKTHWQFNQNLKEERRIPCSSCNNVTRHAVVASAEGATEVQDFTVWDQFEIVQCLGCERLSFRKDYQSTDEMVHDPEDDSDILITHEEVYPPRVVGRPLLNYSHFLPYEVSQIYRETHQALCSGQLVLAGVGIRALIEAVCKEKGVPGKNLEKRIDSLASEGVLTKAGAEILHSLRTMGNTAAHEVKPHGENELNTAFDVVEHLLLGVYILPAKAAILPGKKNSGGGEGT